MSAAWYPCRRIMSRIGEPPEGLVSKAEPESPAALDRPKEPATGRVFRFGDVARLRTYFNDPEALPALDPVNLWSLRAQDLIVTPRPRSTLIEALFLLRVPNRRPAIVTVSDGYIFARNARKPVNRRYGWLNRHVLGDRLMVAQPRASLQDICEDLDAVVSVVDYEPVEARTRVEQPVLVLVSGNDPFLDLPRDAVIAAFVDAYGQLRNRFGDAIRICLSAPNAALAKPVLAACPRLSEIGRIVDSGVPPERCIFAGSPSTVLHDQFLAGRPVHLLPIYDGSGVERFCAPFSDLLAADTGAEDMTVAHRVPSRLQRPAPVDATELVATPVLRRAPMFGPGRFLRELQPLVLANEIRLLFQGWGDNRR